TQVIGARPFRAFDGLLSPVPPRQHLLEPYESILPIGAVLMSRCIHATGDLPAGLFAKGYLWKCAGRMGDLLAQAHRGKVQRQQSICFDRNGDSVLFWGIFVASRVRATKEKCLRNLKTGLSIRC